MALPLKEKVRQQNYKELADTDIKLLNDIGLRTQEWHYLLAQSYFNRWDNESALRHVDKAIAGLPPGSYLFAPYRRLRGEIQWKRTLDQELREQRADNRQANYGRR